MGVLTGIQSSLNFTGGTMQLSASGTRSSSHQNFSSTGGVTASSNLTGLSTFSAINETLSNSCLQTSGCFPNGNNTNLSSTTSLTKTDSSWLIPTATVAAGSLNNYVGTGSVGSTLTVQASVNLTTATDISNPQAILALSGLTGNQKLTYTYLNHANASFASGSDSNSLSLTTLTGGGSGFSVFNYGNASTTKLDYFNVQCAGDCTAFNLTLATLQNLATGQPGVAGSASLTALGAGNYGATYTLKFKDDDAIGATQSQLENSLTLNVQGTVPAVPEPGSWALLSIGLLGLSFCRRKK